jgi:hypothetical protein
LGTPRFQTIAPLNSLGLLRLATSPRACLSSLIAAVADCNDLAVLHYDRDYDVIAEKTDLSFTSEWLVPRGTL